MLITQGTINLAQLLVPGIYTQIIPPPQLNINGVPSNKEGIIGSASWGPVNSPVNLGNLAQAAAVFAGPQPRKYDLLTQVALSGLQGANNFVLVRVTDGTDTAAQVSIQGADLVLTSKYTGSQGNSTQVSLGAGTKAATWKVTVAMPGLVPEAFDNVGAGLAGNALWLAIANAINAGTSAQRGPSQLIVASAGAGADAPAAASFTLAGGTDGAAGIDGAILLGQDIVPRKGMYALRGTGAAIGVLADCDDSTTWSTQVAYGMSEATYMIGTGPLGDTISNATTTKATAGIDNPWFKLLFGDWVYWNDTYNDQLRFVSPQGIVAGWLAANGPQFSSLNQPLQGIAGTQKTYANQQYSSADQQALAAAGIDCIMNPSPGGNYFSCFLGHNSSSDPSRSGDNYTRMTDYLATTINQWGGKFVGELITPSEEQDAEDALGHWLDTLADQEPPMIGNSLGTLPYSVEIDGANNPLSQTAEGIQVATVMVTYLAINEKFLVNLIGGTTVQVTSATQQGLAA
ncbi:MAG: phage tail protein [Steroidobacteraceae bacterium]